MYDLRCRGDRTVRGGFLEDLVRGVLAGYGDEIRPVVYSAHRTQSLRVMIMLPVFRPGRIGGAGIPAIPASVGAASGPNCGGVRLAELSLCD